MASTHSSEDEEDGPPEDFRFLSVAPTIDDLYEDRPYIRVCKIFEPYESAEHYLDVQFRLLREDFFKPLRRGLYDYLHFEKDRKHRNSDVRVYKKVKLETPDIKKNSVGIKVFFGILKYINWQHSKRFMTGGLLLLSSNNFKNIIFVTVANRNQVDLEKGFLLVEPCSTEKTKITRDMYKAEYVMLESKIYFEPYIAVLRAIRNFNEDNFPMKNYLVYASNASKQPDYISRVRILRYKKFYLPTDLNKHWPSAEDLKLDISQYNAFKHALTEELAVIQGPPGTGKTFLSLEIVRALLQNKDSWKRLGPIVVVCYTNHALDQFLEGIKTHTKSIVRIGGRSKSEVLKPFTLVEKRKSFRTEKNYDAKRQVFLSRRELEDVMSEIARVRKTVNYLTTPNAIVPLECFKVSNKDLKKIKNNDDLVKWLFEDKLPLALQSFNKTEEPKKNESDALEPKNEESDDDELVDTKLELAYNLDITEEFECIYPLERLKSIMNEVTGKINLVKNVAESSQQKDMHNNELDELEYHKTVLNEELQFLERQFNQHPLLFDLQDFYESKRWRTYWTWVKQSHEICMSNLTDLEATYREKLAQLNKLSGQVDLNILREHLIIGLTTTCAAKLHDTINDLGAPIVLVEEAAEILEAHVLCSLTKSCQHVILIGDHKQLRPKASVYELGRDYNLNVSLFERILRIRGNCNQLAYQHRMSPEIAQLITPSIYETLFNHPSVYNHPNVKGLVKNIFFINHSNHETNFKNEESYVNAYEAKYLIAFANHLVMQGYSVNDITVLCTYVGQLFEIRKETSHYNQLKHLNVTTVDNYQGEENKIILLSLVRNNGKGNIGFLKEENRVCVALSRAREGLYIMGNMADLIFKNSIWPKIKSVLEKQQTIGNYLEVQCQIHVDQIMQIKTASDFKNKSPSGGCQKKCGTDLCCGHVCDSICHIVDREHENYKCLKPCPKLCPNDHECPFLCWQGCKPCQVLVDCTLNCGHTIKIPCSADPNTFKCYVQVAVTLADCEHKVQKPCSLPIDKVLCSYACNIRLPCGHACEKNCHVNVDPDHVEYKCTKECPRTYPQCESNHRCKLRCFEECQPCPILVEKKRSCGHYYKKIACSVKIEEYYCTKPCRQTLSCNHKCPMKCSEPCGNCPKKVIKKSTCGHDVQVKCCEEAAPYLCSGRCSKLLSCGHPCTARCKDPCTICCQAKVKLMQTGLCGHILEVPCYLSGNDPKNPALLQYCRQPCKTMLKCTHQCTGSCGECKQGRIHISCTEPCKNIFVCGHQCRVPCRQDCLPCDEPCEVECEHSKCNKKCGTPCATCKEKCTRKCKHKSCPKQCGEMCDVEPCNEPCDKLLKCEHPCVGFCGEPCPPLCRICDQDELKEIFFGNEDEPDARFVYLEDCKHSIENNGLIQWMRSSDGSVELKTCPRCKTPIKNCKRIMNEIKKHWQDVMKVKNRIFYDKSRKDLENIQKHHMKTLEELEKNDFVIKEFRQLEDVLQKLSMRGALVSKNRRRQNLSVKELDAFRILLDILTQIFEVLSKGNKGNSLEFLRDQVSMLAESIPASSWVVTDQNITDIQLEIKRLHYMIEVCNIGLTDEKQLNLLKIELKSFERFNEERELRVQKKIRQLVEDYKKFEIQAIVKAVDLPKGHWYKCPNGHIYAIGECGGAMELSKCADCGAAIGGSQHRTLDSNRFAGEVDGASNPAWPGQFGYGFVGF